MFQWLEQTICGWTGHGNLVRERTEDGQMGYRCETCHKLHPNTFNMLGTDTPHIGHKLYTPVEPNYKPAKARLTRPPKPTVSKAVLTLELG